MFIKAARIKNFRPFSDFKLTPGVLNIPDGENEGSGLTVFVGENGTGKTTVLEALSIPLIAYKAEGIVLSDFKDLNNDIDIKLASNRKFTVKKTMPNSDFQAVGFFFQANLRNRNTSAYLVGPVVNDTKFIADSDEGIRESSVDLRVAVSNPFSGQRFNENDYLFIDKNRNKQLESGMFSSTRFDRILDNFNFQYLRVNHENLKEPDKRVFDEIDADSITNTYLRAALDEFKSMCGYDVKLSFIDNELPYSKAFLSYQDGESEQLPVTKMGNGYQMLLAILCQYHLSLQSGKKLIIFIDEAELHLHYKIQQDLANLLLKISKDAQVIITTHSSELLKNLLPNTAYRINILKRTSTGVSINPTEEYVLPTPSVNETAYIALGVDSIEYFNELYGYLQDLKHQIHITDFDAEISSGQTMIDWERTDGRTESLTIHSCIRHKVHHPDNTLNDSKFEFYAELPKTISFLRDTIKVHIP